MEEEISRSGGGGISGEGVGPLVRVEGRMNGDGYQTMLNQKNATCNPIAMRQPKIIQKEVWHLI